MPLRRTQSYFALGAKLMVPRTKMARSSSATESSETLRPATPKASNDRLQDAGPVPSEDDSSAMRGPENEVPRPASTHQDAQGDLDGPHLHTMAISQQLRSMSALSETSADEDRSLLSANEAWNFHRREKSAISGSSGRTRHARIYSSFAGFASGTGIPERVRSPAASSTYSRPSSMLETTAIDNDLAQRMMQTYDIPATLDGADSDWPLLPSMAPGTLKTPHSAAEGQEPPSQASIPPREILGSTHSTTTAGDDSPTVKWSSPPMREDSMPSKDSSSHLTVSSVRSRVRDRLSSTRKVVRKRRSIFKFLRPGSRKQQGRSISSPILRSKASEAFNYDGPSDEAATLTVEYELSDYAQPSIASRAASVSQLDQRRGTSAFLAIPDGVPQRRPSLADYERNLTAAGDDRRRPSTLNVQKLQEVQEDDRRQSTSLRHKISRTKTFHDKPTELMAQALEKHQDEKALFRSASKRREVLGESTVDTPQFRTSISTAGRLSLPPSTPAGHNDLLDPLERPPVKISAGRSHSTGYLLPPGPTETYSRPSSFLAPSSYACTTATGESPPRQTIGTVDRGSPESPAATSRIGTKLSSWARFPSHSRIERCGPAGSPDDVISRDFAFDSEAADRSEAWDLEAASPVSKKHGKNKTELGEKRSTTFGGLVRYYSGIFSSSTSPQNRRSSIATGGWLANPDLELLPPATSNEPAFPHHDHHFKERLHQLEHELERASEERRRLRRRRSNEDHGSHPEVCWFHRARSDQA